MKNKINITEDLYLSTIERLNFIKKEQTRLIKEKQDHLVNIKNLTTFESFMITLRRETRLIETEMKLIKKRFLQPFGDNKTMYNQMDGKIDQLIFVLNNPTEAYQLEIKDTELFPLINNYPTFQILFTELKELAHKRIASINLLNYSLELQREEDELLKIEYLYKKQLDATPKTTKKGTKSLKRKKAKR